MAFKFVILFATLAAVNCGVLQPAYQHTQAIYPAQQATYAHAAYAQPAYAHAAYAQPAYVQPAVYKQATIVKQVVQEAPANYDFNYDVHDTHTGDIKQQNEKAVNGVITGQYSLIDADGYRRVVDYTADDVHGFQANVRREPLNVKVAQPQYVQKIIAQPQISVQKVYAQPAYNAWQQPASHNAWQSAPNNGWNTVNQVSHSNPWN